MQAYDIIDRLPFYLAGRLTADEFFVDIPVVVAEEGNVAQMVQVQQATQTSKGQKRGVAVIVLQMVADDQQNIQFGPMTLKPAFQVVEVLELNRDASGTQKSARKVARRIRDVIKRGNMSGIIADMKPGKPCIQPMDLGEQLGKLVKAYQVNFECLEVPAAAMSQVQMPVFSQFGNAAKFQITCPTAGADIWFTTDESYPVPTTALTTSTAKQYRAPVDIPAGGVTVMACAYVAGSIASSVSRAFIDGNWA